MIKVGQRRFTGYRPIFQGMWEVLKSWGNMIRSRFIRIIVGIISGTGAAIGTWVSYGQAKQGADIPKSMERDTSRVWWLPRL